MKIHLLTIGWYSNQCSIAKWTVTALKQSNHSQYEVAAKLLLWTVGMKF